MKKKSESCFPEMGRLKRLFRTMKLSIIMLSCVASAWATADSYAQTTRLSMNIQEASVNDVIQYIEDHSDYYFLYKDNVVDVNRKVNVELVDAPIEQVLALLFNGESIHHEVRGRQIIVTEKEGEERNPQISKERNIFGTVTNNKGELLPGATVVIKGTTIGTVTDIEGKFSLMIPETAATLVVSFIGLNTVEMAITDQEIYNVVLEEKRIDFDEVIVVAYGTTTKSSFVGSASVVTKDKLEKIQTSNAVQALQGMSSGVQVINNSGQPGADATVVIRGIGSMNASISPLYVVDGVPYGGYINAISPSDIESMTVLKDATASALYGSRAANGVIIITTKQGKKEEGQINFRSTLSFAKLAVDLPRSITPQEYAETSWKAIYFEAMDGGLSETDAATLATNNLANELKINPFSSATPVGTNGRLSPDANLLFEGDWRNELLQSRPRQEYTLDFSGKNDKTNYYFSGSYLNDKGIFTTQEFKRISGRANVTSKVKYWLEIGSNTSFAHSETQSPAGSSTVWFLRTIPSIYPVYEYDYANNQYKDDGNGNRIYDYGNNRKSWIGWNPLADAAYNRYLSLVDNISSRNFVEVKFLTDFKFRSTFSLDYYLTSYHGYTTPDYGFMIGRGEVSKNTTRAATTTITNLLTYETKIGQHSINVLAGQEAFKFLSNYLTATREDLPFGGLYELSSAATMTGSSSTEQNYRLSSWFSRLEYDYANKYYASGSIRTDATSRFSAASRNGVFWSLGASWRISEESFISGEEWLDNLKIKASYGAVGNDGISTYYAYQGLYGTGFDDYGLPGLMISRLPNESLKWETNLQFNVGMEFSVLNRLNGSLEYFSRKSKDLLFTRPMAPSTGFSGIDRNIGDIENKGFEFDINWRVVDAGSLKWNIGLNATHYKNVITKLPQKEMNAGVFKWKEGESRYNFWGAEYAGINPENGNDQWWKNVYETVDGEKILTERVLTENSSDVSGDDQKKYLGNALPDLFGGITNTLNFKGLDFSFMFYYCLGGKLYDSDYSQMMGYREGFSFHPDILDSWTPENNTSKITRFSKAYSNSQQTYSSKFVFDNTFVRLRNVSLGYTLPKSLMNKLQISTLRFFIQGDNIYTWGEAVKRGTDPEQGIDGRTGNRFPIVKSMTVGLQIGL